MVCCCCCQPKPEILEPGNRLDLQVEASCTRATVQEVKWRESGQGRCREAAGLVIK